MNQIPTPRIFKKVETLSELQGLATPGGRFERTYDGILVRIYFDHGRWQLASRNKSTTDGACPRYLRNAQSRLNFTGIRSDQAYVGILRMPELVLADYRAPRDSVEIRLIGTYKLRPNGTYNRQLQPINPVDVLVLSRQWMTPTVVIPEDLSSQNLTLDPNVPGWVYVNTEGHRQLWIHPNFKKSLEIKNGHLTLEAGERQQPMVTWKSFPPRGSPLNQLYWSFTKEWRINRH